MKKDHELQMGEKKTKIKKVYFVNKEKSWEMGEEQLEVEMENIKLERISKLH